MKRNEKLEIAVNATVFILHFQSNLTTETLQQQFLKVKQRTNLSHVQEYGQMVSVKKMMGRIFQ
jgi:hypothetical protein